MKTYKLFTVNWAAILSFAIFWLWGLNAYPAGSTLNNNIVNGLIICLYSYYVFNFNSEKFETTFFINYRKAIFFAIFCLVIIFISWQNLVQPLWGDQLYHSGYAARYGQFFIFFAEQKYPLIWSRFNGFSATTIIWVVNVFVLGINGIVFLLLPRLFAKYKNRFVIIMVGVLLLFRMILFGDSGFFSGVTVPVFLTDYSSDPHPVFRLFPLLISSTIFGVSDFGYRCAAFSMYLLFLLFLFVKIDGRVGWRLAITATLAIGTLPILWHVSYLVEQSVWSTLASATVFVIMFSSKDMDSIPLIPVLAIVIIATLLRSPAFVAFAPVAALIFYRILIGDVKRIEKLPLFLMVATLSLFVLISVSRGSPATEDGGQFVKWFYAESNNIPAIASASVLGMVPLFYIGLSLGVSSRSHLVRFGSIVIFLGLCGFVYYAPLMRTLWGVSRYQAEMYVPLITAGVVAYCMNYDNESKRKWIVTLPLIFLSIVNIFSLTTFDSRSFRPFPDNPTPGEAIKSEVEYPISQAFQFIKDHNLKNNAYYVGIYYGGFTSILRGYSASDYLNFTNLNNRYRDGFSVSAESIDNDQEILCVVIEPEASSGAIKALEARGWKGRYEFTHARSGRKMIVITRKDI